MAVIDIRRQHAMSREKAVAAADRLAADLARDYDLNFQWDGDLLRFKRMGAKGWLQVEDAAIAIHLELGLLLRPFKGRIEQEVSQNLDNFVAGRD
ncbi:MAG: polyhydroxyalkanoic acid system family protein [Oleiphilaceae bacterium]|nr:polyhydroxyalkanoic acid system family protein [Oleiphilaceae bacterium]